MKVAAMIAEVMTPLMLATERLRHDDCAGIGGGGNLLHDLGRRRDAADAGDADDRVELAARTRSTDM
jgi:hypothetical protein